jgi:hypothetical protein
MGGNTQTKGVIMDEFEKIKKRSECSGEGDCENCSCWGSCEYGITLPDYYDGADE